MKEPISRLLPPQSHRRGIAQSVGGSASVLLVTSLGSVLLAINLSPADRGLVVAALAWPPIFAQLGSLGLSTATIYWCAADPDSSSEIGGSALLATLLLSIPVSIVTLTLLPHLLAGTWSSISHAVIVLAAAQPVGMLASIACSVTQGRGRLGRLAVLRTLAPAGTLVGVALVSIGARPAALVIASTLTVANLTTLVIAAGAERPFSFRYFWLKRLLDYGVRAVGAEIAQTINVRADVAMMTLIMTPSALGIYVVAVSSVVPIRALGQGLQMAILPLARLRGGNRVTLRNHQLMELSLVWLALAGICVTASVFLFQRLHAGAYRHSIPISCILIIASFPLMGRDVATAMAQAADLPGLASRAETAGLVFTLISLYPALRLAQGIGASLVSLAAYSTSACVLFLGLASHQRRLENSGVLDRLSPERSA